ncbi:hypothetical protein NDQ71_11020 [Pseudoalteromonas sp. KG3]|uniref:hypothetical protein n=1 Tax=Pseudoalteromonas TaxID=53246 RepID=UPI00265AFD80|nr:hypothetical protein [Pseudoalteromonas sp. KG3]WKD22218.1 hypothetical protein NDQ71_11020 [Pseudoalteromonas sp. KG3]
MFKLTLLIRDIILKRPAHLPIKYIRDQGKSMKNHLLFNTELLKDQKFHDMVNSYAGILGISVSAASAKDLASTIWKTKK